MDHFPYSKNDAFWHFHFLFACNLFLQFRLQFCRYFNSCNLLLFLEILSPSPKFLSRPSSSHFFPRIAYTLVQIPSTVGRCVVTMQVRGYVSVIIFFSTSVSVATSSAARLLHPAANTEISNAVHAQSKAAVPVLLRIRRRVLSPYFQYHPAVSPQIPMHMPVSTPPRSLHLWLPVSHFAYFLQLFLKTSYSPVAHKKTISLWTATVQSVVLCLPLHQSMLLPPGHAARIRSAAASLSFPRRTGRRVQ